MSDQDNARHRLRRHTSPRTRNATTHRTVTVLLSLTGVLVAAVYIGSLVSYSLATPETGQPQSWSGPAARHAMIAMYAVIAAFVLAFTVAVRRTDQP